MLNIFSFWKSKKSKLDEAHDTLYKTLVDNKEFIRFKSCTINGFDWERKLQLSDLDITVSGSFYSEYTTIKIDNFTVDQKYSYKFKNLLLSINNNIDTGIRERNFNEINRILGRLNSHPVVLDCPFCGSKPKEGLGTFTKPYKIGCSICGISFCGTTRGEVLYRWNRRVGD